MSELAIPTCPSCTYELKGLPLRGRCPECGNQYSLSLPGFEPGSLRPSSRYQRFAYDQSLARKSLLKSVTLTVVCVSVIAAWKSADAKQDGAQEAVDFLIRYGIALAAALVVYFVSCTTGIIEYSGPFLRAVLGVSGALAGGLLAQHITAQVLGFLLGVPWLIGLLVFLGLSADLLELDLTEAALFSILILGARVMLKFLAFDHMFEN